MKNYIKKTVDIVSGFGKDCKTECIEIKQAIKLMWASRKRKLTHEEKMEVEDQSLDVARLTFLTALFIIPGSGILIIVLVKLGSKVGIRLLPSAFIKTKT